MQINLYFFFFNLVAGRVSVYKYDKMNEMFYLRPHLTIGDENVCASQYITTIRSKCRTWSQCCCQTEALVT